MNNAIERLDDLIVLLEAQRDLAQERLNLVVNLRQTWPDCPPPKLPTARNTAQVVHCPDCGRVFKSRQALGPHRRACSGSSEGQPAPKPIEAEPEMERKPKPLPTIPGKGFECEDCGVVTDTVQEMINHCRQDHGRRPWTTERMPRQLNEVGTDG